MKFFSPLNKDNNLFCKLRDLLDAVKSFSNIKVGLGVSYYEEIILFTLSSFKDSRSTVYRNYNIIKNEKFLNQDCDY
jgi:hypothetical protein